MKRILVAVLLLLSSGYAYADRGYFFKTDKLYKACVVEQGKPVSDGMCIGYILGVLDTAPDMIADCVPVDTTAKELVDIMRLWLVGRVRDKDTPVKASVDIGAAVMLAFCPDKVRQNSAPSVKPKDKTLRF